MRKLQVMGMLSILILMLILSACQSSADLTSATATQELGKTVEVEGGSYKNISVSELQILLENKDFTLVNVHIPFDGNLPKTDISTPYDTIAQNLDKLPGDKTAKIVLYCRSGRMSAIAAQDLVHFGYTNILNLDGGMAAWEQEGQTIER
jgi:rhodanese-related sulfurtransferase